MVQEIKTFGLLGYQCSRIICQLPSTCNMNFILLLFKNLYSLHCETHVETRAHLLGVI